MSVLSDAVSSPDDGETYEFRCPGVQGSPCGGDDLPGFVSTGWPSKKVATARGQQHFAEHKGEGAMPPLHEFRAEHGLTPSADGTKAIRLEDLP